MAQTEKLSCGDLGVNEEILGFVTSNKVFASWDNLTAWFDLIFSSVTVNVTAW